MEKRDGSWVVGAEIEMWISQQEARNNVSSIRPSPKIQK